MLSPTLMTFLWSGLALVLILCLQLPSVDSMGSVPCQRHFSGSRAIRVVCVLRARNTYGPLRVCVWILLTHSAIEEIVQQAPTQVAWHACPPHSCSHTCTHMFSCILTYTFTHMHTQFKIKQNPYSRSVPLSRVVVLQPALLQSGPGPCARSVAGNLMLLSVLLFLSFWGSRTIKVLTNTENTTFVL